MDAKSQREGKMKRKPYNSNLKFYLILFALAFSVGIAGCSNEDDFIFSVEQNVDAENAASKNSNEAMNLSAEAFYYLSSIASGVSITSTGCPLISVSSSQGNGGTVYTITVDYGTTLCESTFDGIRRSGKYQINGFINTAHDSLYGSLVFPTGSPLRIFRICDGTDTNFAQVCGTNIIYGKKTVSQNLAYSGMFLINNTFTTNYGQPKIFNLSISVNAEFNDPYSPNDDVFILTGNGSVTDNCHGLQFSYSMQDNMKKTGYFRYPTKGTIALQRQNSQVPVTLVDFSPDNESNDDVVKVSRDSFTKTYYMESASQ
jgi:hypothetical protein